MLSSFELVRGYTPSVEGTGKVMVPKKVLAAHQEMESRRLLQKMLKLKPNHVRDTLIKVGENVLCLLPGGKRKRGHWVECTVTEIPDKHTVAVGKGRNRRIVAIEDVRTIPKAELAEAMVRATYNVPKRKKKPVSREQVETISTGDDSSTES